MRRIWGFWAGSNRAHAFVGKPAEGIEGMVSVGGEPWKFVPLVLLVLVVTSFQLVLSRQEEVNA